MTPFYVPLCCWNTPTYPSTEELEYGCKCGMQMKLLHACGELPNLLELLLHHGPSYTYYPTPPKCCLIIDQKSVSHCLFNHTDIRIVSIHHFLGGIIGDSYSSMQFVTEKVQKWVSSVHNLSEIVVSWPQAAYADMTKYFQFAPLDHTVSVWYQNFQLEYQVFSLPVRWGGLG